MPAFADDAQGHGKGIHRLAILHQLSAPLPSHQTGRRQRQVVHPRFQLDRLALLLAGIAGNQFGLSTLVALVEGEQAQLRLVTGAEQGRPTPFQVQRLFRADEVLALPHFASLIDCAHGDAPAGQ